jgi:hypothetical protein
LTKLPFGFVVLLKVFIKTNINAINYYNFDAPVGTLGPDNRPVYGRTDNASLESMTMFQMLLF